MGGSLGRGHRIGVLGRARRSARTHEGAYSRGENRPRRRRPRRLFRTKSVAWGCGVSLLPRRSDRITTRRARCAARGRVPSCCVLARSTGLRAREGHASSAVLSPRVRRVGAWGMRATPTRTVSPPARASTAKPRARECSAPPRADGNKPRAALAVSSAPSPSRGGVGLACSPVVAIGSRPAVLAALRAAGCPPAACSPGVPGSARARVTRPVPSFRPASVAWGCGGCAQPPLEPRRPPRERARRSRAHASVPRPSAPTGTRPHAVRAVSSAPRRERARRSRAHASVPRLSAPTGTNPAPPHYSTQAQTAGLESKWAVRTQRTVWMHRHVPEHTEPPSGSQSVPDSPVQRPNPGHRFAVGPPHGGASRLPASRCSDEAVVPHAAGTPKATATRARVIPIVRRAPRSTRTTASNERSLDQRWCRASGGQEG